jgi:16S rRNA processing protein RimM
MQYQYSYPEDRYILIGTVGKAQGLRGEVNIHPLSDQPENLEAYDALVLVDKRGKLSPKLTITKFRVHKGKAIILFDRVVDRTHAEQLAGMGVLLAREDLPELAEDEFYWHQITGLPVKTVDGRYLGTMISVFSNGAQDIMVISEDDQEFLVPLTKGIIVEQSDTLLVIDPPEGLLEINTGEEDTGNDYPA